MILTESKAREKWCPEGRLLLSDVTPDKKSWSHIPHFSAFNRIFSKVDLSTDARGRCIASDCMFWRWHCGDGAPEINTHGYCWKAGRP